MTALEINRENTSSDRLIGLEEQFCDLLQITLSDAGWHSRKADNEVDLIVQKEETRYAVEMKVVTEHRWSSVEGRLATAFVQSMHAAKKIGQGTHPLAVIGMPLASARMANNVRTFTEKYLPSAGWGLMDLAGRVELHGPGLDWVKSPKGRLVRRKEYLANAAGVTGGVVGQSVGTSWQLFRSSLPASNGARLFTDLGQWMLKVLLSRHLPAPLIQQVKGEFWSPQELAKAARVSAPSAWRHVTALGASGFLEIRSKGYELVRLSELLRLWRGATAMAGREWKMRFILPQRDGLRALREVMRSSASGTDQVARPRACLGLFSAADALGARFVHGGPIHLYSERPSAEECARLGLRLAEPGEAVDVFIREPRFPEALFRAAVRTEDGVLTADALQTWLDVVDYPARGSEQAEVLWRLIGPALEGAGE
jgi:biotin operon repressor